MKHFRTLENQKILDNNLRTVGSVGKCYFPFAWKHSHVIILVDKISQPYLLLKVDTNQGGQKSLWEFKGKLWKQERYRRNAIINSSHICGWQLQEEHPGNHRDVSEVEDKENMNLQPFCA